MKIEIWNEGKVKYRRDSLNDDVVIEALNQPNYTVLVDGKKLTLSDVSGSVCEHDLTHFAHKDSNCSNCGYTDKNSHEQTVR